MQEPLSSFGKEWKPALHWVTALKPYQTGIELFTNIKQNQVEEGFDMIQVVSEIEIYK